MVANPTSYSVYALHVLSTLPLPEVPVINSNGRSPDVQIRAGDVDPVTTESNDTGRRRVRVTRNNCRMTYEGIGSVRVTNGDTVTYSLSEPSVAETKALRRVILNHAFAAVLLQRGLLVLHASAVLIDNQVAVFLGHRTAGKSTTAAAFRKCGYQVLGDDVIGIRFDMGAPQVVPGVPEIRLAPDAVAELGINDAVEPTGDRGPKRLYCRLSDDRSPAPLYRCYRLKNAESVELVSQSRTESFFTLLKGTYARGALSQVDRVGEHFNQCEGTLEAADVRTLRRPKQFMKLQAVVDTVVSDMTQG